MLPAIKDFKEASAIVRDILVKYCQLNPSKVVSSLAVRGADLSKPISPTEFNSPNLSDTFIVFDIEEDDTKDYFVFEEDDYSDTMISNLVINLKIYGKHCADIVRMIIVVFKNEKILQEIYNEGVYYKGISKPTSKNEFINNTMWPRRDISLQAQIRTIIDKPIPTEYFPIPKETEEDIKEIGSSLKVKNI